MTKKPFFPVFFLIFAVPAFLAAQDGFMPSVTRIRAEAKDNLVRLSWVDSPDARGPVYIFRSARPYSGYVPVNIRPVVVKYGTQFYVDDAIDMDSVYYFIAASEVSGRRYDIIVPQMNSVVVNVSAPNEPVDISPLVTEGWSAEGLFNLRARNDGERVVVTFNTANPKKSAVLYRSARPVMKTEDLLDAVTLRSEVVSPFVDMPAPDTAWYYTVIYEEEISSGEILIKPGVNTTVSAVFAYNDRTAYGFMRPAPLPILTLSGYAEGGFMPEVTREVPLSRDAQNAVGSLRPLHEKPHVLKEPRVYAIDMEAPPGGEESALVQIIKEYFEKFDWEGARVNLQYFLSVPRSKDVKTRADFYHAQSLYYTGRYREALMKFLSFRTENPVEANSWIEAALSAMVR